MTTGDGGGPDHPNAVRHPLPCPCPTNLTLPPDALIDSSKQSSHATALLLAGETFLAAARDLHKPSQLRTELEKAAFKLLEASARKILQAAELAG